MDKSNAKAKLQEHLITINSIRAIRKDLAAGRMVLRTALRDAWRKKVAEREATIPTQMQTIGGILPRRIFDAMQKQVQ